MNLKTLLSFALFVAVALFLVACEKDESIEERKEYFTDGTIKSITTYRDSVKDGKYISFYENGYKKEDGFYKDDKRKGLWNEWHENGQLKSEVYYKNGEKKWFCEILV